MGRREPDRRRAWPGAEAPGAVGEVPAKPLDRLRKGRMGIVEVLSVRGIPLRVYGHIRSNRAGCPYIPVELEHSRSSRLSPDPATVLVGVSEAIRIWCRSPGWSRWQLRLAESADLYDRRDGLTVPSANAAAKATAVVGRMLAGADPIDELDLLSTTPLR